MARVVVAGHESGELRELDLDSGMLHPSSILRRALAASIERLWPKESRGRWQTIGGRTFVLYRVGTRLHFRAGDDVVELGPALRMTLTSGRPENRLLAERDGQPVLDFRYPSQAGRLVDSFIDPYEEEEDLDLVLFTAKLATHPGRRQRIFATEDEIRLGELTPEDLMSAVRESAAAVFPKTRVKDLCREVRRWQWGWAASQLEGWGPNCGLCGGNPVSRQIVSVVLRPALSFSMEWGVKAEIGLCADCITDAFHFFARPDAPRADAAMADIARALHARGSIRDAEAVDRLTSESTRVPAQPVSSPGAECALCRSRDNRTIAGTGRPLCETCMGNARAAWRASMDRFYERQQASTAPSRWEEAGFVWCFEGPAGPRRLQVWLDPLPDRPLEVFAHELARWDVPYEDDAIDAKTRERFRREIEAIVREKFQRDVSFRDDAA